MKKKKKITATDMAKVFFDNRDCGKYTYCNHEFYQ